MNIAFLISSFPKISETFVTNQITALLDAGHDIEIFAFKKPNEDELHEAVREYDLLDRTHYITNPKTYVDGLRILSTLAPRLCTHEETMLSHVLGILRNGTKAPRQYVVFHELVQADRFDIYHAHFGPVGEAIRPAVEALEAPLTVSFYGHDISEVIDRNPNAYDQLFRSANAVLALSNEMQDRLRNAGCPDAKIHKQPLMIDVNEYPFRKRTLPIDKPIEILTVARLVEKKGIRYAVKALGRLETDQEIRFRIIGDGPQSENIKKTAAALGLDENVKILGFRDHEEVKEWLNRSHLFILPSVTAENGDREGTPTILLEAQAAGLPVVSTQHAGIPEIVSDGESGLLVPERDVKSLADALQTLLSQPERWPEMGKAGRRFVKEQHTPSTLVEDLEEVYAGISAGDDSDR